MFCSQCEVSVNAAGANTVVSLTDEMSNSAWLQQLQRRHVISLAYLHRHRGITLQFNTSKTIHTE